MTPEQKAVILDYAQELQTNDEPWLQFEFKSGTGEWTYCCIGCNPLTYSAMEGFNFRRRPKTITVTLPVPTRVIGPVLEDKYLCIHAYFADSADRDTALAAIRAEMQEPTDE